jgi:hypothetical protein
MSSGLRVYDSNGAITLDVTDRVLRVIHVELVLAKAPPRDVYISRLVQGAAWATGTCAVISGAPPLVRVFTGYITVQGGSYYSDKPGSDGYVTVMGYG